jgi:hypothetical protein
MKFTKTCVATVAALFVGQSFATIDYGKAYYNDGHVDNAAWIDGDSACSYSYLGPESTPPCDYNGGQFYIEQNGHTYYIEGCGGNFQLLNGDHTFNSYAHYNPYNNAAQGCHNQYGDYYVDQEWSFY